ncbi:MAG: GumC family protein [Deltaproteobacteria bacterium]|nr:GumC family protein [Deltaproteobacteria bacterium]
MTQPAKNQNSTTPSEPTPQTPSSKLPPWLASGSSDEQQIHLIDYYHVLLRHKWTIVLSLVLTVLLVLYHNTRLTPIYQATSTIIIDKEKDQSPLTGQRTDYESYMSESLTFNTHFELIRARPVMERVIQKLDLTLKDLAPRDGKPPFAPVNAIRQFIGTLKKNVKLLIGWDKRQEQQQGGGITPTPLDETTVLVQTLQGMVQIMPIEETRLVRLSVMSPIPQVARDVANAAAQAYIDFNLANRLESSQDTLSWLTDNLYETKKQLEDAEQDFLAYKQDARLVSLEDTQQVTAQKVREFNEEYIKARNKRVELDAKLRELRQIAQSGKNVPHVRSLLENPLINELYARLVKAEVELESLSKVYKSKHPKIVQVETDIENTRQKLHSELLKEIENLKSERAVLVSREQVLLKTMQDFEAEALDTNRKELRYNILQRNVEMNKNLYDTLLSRMKETDITGTIDVSNIRITEEAVMPQMPVRPNKKRNLMLAVILGLMLGVGMSFLREYMDRTIRTEEDVQRYLNLSVLSVIPNAEQATGKGYYGPRSSRSKQSDETAEA